MVNFSAFNALNDHTLNGPQGSNSHFVVLKLFNLFSETHLMPKLTEAADFVLSTLQKDRETLIEQVCQFLVTPDLRTSLHLYLVEKHFLGIA